MYVLDSSVWVSHFVVADVFHELSAGFVNSLVKQRPQLASPSLLLPELGGAVSRRSGNSRLADSIVALVQNLPYIHLVPLDERLAQNSASLAVRLELKGADAVYLALAQDVDVPLVTWDDEMLKRGSLVHTVHQPSDLFSGSVSP